MMLIEYFKDVSTTWKISIFVIAFGTWPLSSIIIFSSDPDLFIALDIMKLALLSSAMAAPFLLINAALVGPLLNPSNPTLKAARLGIDVMSSSVMISTFFTTLVLSIGAIFTLLGAERTTTITAIGISELIFILITSISIYQERE